MTDPYEQDSPIASSENLTLSKGQVSYYELKCQWYEKEAAERPSSRPMTKPIAPWQWWRCDPAAQPILYKNGRTDSETFVKFDPSKPNILQKLTYRPAAIVSSELVHRRALVWICRRTTPDRAMRAPWAVPVGRYRGEPSFLFVPQLHTVSSDIALDPAYRELLTYEGDVQLQHRQAISDAIGRFVLGELGEDADAPAPGTIVHCTSGHASFDAFVVASCMLFRENHEKRRNNPILTCRMVDYATGDEELGTDGVVVLRQDGVSGYANVPVSVNAAEMRVIPRRYVEVTGTAATYLGAVRSALLSLRAKL